jgi:hypothetical protein
MGIDPARAASDPVVFLGALDVIAAHYVAGRDAYAAGQTQAAGEMFAHPISEVYADLEGVLTKQGVPPFQEKMEKASDLALNKAPAAQVNRAVDDVLSSLKSAALKAPKDDRSGAAVEARVIADMIDRASLQYAVAVKEPALEPYLDGYGFFRAAERRMIDAIPIIAAQDKEAAETIRKASVLLARAYPTALRPSAPKVPPGELLGAASRVKLMVEGMR